MVKNSLLLIIITCHFLSAQQSHFESAIKLKEMGLQDLESYAMLYDLTSKVGHRFSGSKGYDKAVIWARDQLNRIGADSVWLESVMVPHWERGKPEECFIIANNIKSELSISALGGSIATPKNGISVQVIEVNTLSEVKLLGNRAKGKIIFYNRPFDKTKVNTFEAYGGAVDQRGSGAIEAAKVGAIGVLVRSMTHMIDRVPHTGTMRYHDSIPKIPAAAISTLDADILSNLLKKDSGIFVHLTLNCKTNPDVQSYNVIGEIRGRVTPDEIVVIGAHLDSWDYGTGAHDDGSGVVHSIDAMRLIKKLDIEPNRTIRCVLFANEENGLRGARDYAARVKKSTQKHIAAIESDKGGFSPRGFGVIADSMQYNQIISYQNLLEIVGAERIIRGGGGVDINLLKPMGTVLIGLNPDNQRYFDYHHSAHDTIDKVHPRELQLGSIAMAILTWRIAQDGI